MPNQSVASTVFWSRDPYKRIIGAGSWFVDWFFLDFRHAGIVNSEPQRYLDGWVVVR